MPHKPAHRAREDHGHQSISSVDGSIDEWPTPCTSLPSTWRAIGLVHGFSGSRNSMPYSAEAIARYEVECVVHGCEHCECNPGRRFARAHLEAGVLRSHSSYDAASYVCCAISQLRFKALQAVAVDVCTLAGSEGNESMLRMQEVTFASPRRESVLRRGHPLLHASCHNPPSTTNRLAL